MSMFRLLGHGLQLGPFLLSAHYRLYKRGRDPPPPNPSRPLRKEERSLLPLEWLLTKGRGKSPTVVATTAVARLCAAAATAATPCPGHEDIPVAAAAVAAADAAPCCRSPWRRRRPQAAAAAASGPPRLPSLHYIPITSSLSRNPSPSPTILPAAIFPSPNSSPLLPQAPRRLYPLSFANLHLLSFAAQFSLFPNKFTSTSL